MRNSKQISDVFKPEDKVAKTCMNGRVIYEDVNYSYLSGDDMREVGKKVAKKFPEFEVWVTGGPYRGYDVKYQVDKKAKIISLDFYSPRPGLQYLKDIIVEIKKSLQND